MKISGEQIDDRVVEVHWDPELDRWRMMRFRDDKPHGNFRTVVENIIQSIADGVEKPMVSHVFVHLALLTCSLAISCSLVHRSFAARGKCVLVNPRKGQWANRHQVSRALMVASCNSLHRQLPRSDTGLLQSRSGAKRLAQHFLQA